jgi:hypothetical protein
VAKVAAYLLSDHASLVTGADYAVYGGDSATDLTTSVENEWLYMNLLAEFGLPVARITIRHFGGQWVLGVERFGQDQTFKAMATPNQFWLSDSLAGISLACWHGRK